ATGVIVTSASQITCILPITGAPAGQWNIVVTNPDTQTGTLNNGFTITALTPTVTAITPATAVNTSSASITDLQGTNFQAGATVALTRTGYANIAATGVIVTSTSQITCTLPITGAAAGQWNIVVTNQDTQTGTLNNGFTITALAPTVTAITPATAVNTSPAAITDLQGTNFQAGATVALTRTGYSNIVATGVIVTSTSQITCTLPITGAAAGQWNIIVTNPDTQTGTLNNGFTITALVPTVTAITPATAVNTSSAAITDLQGTNFQSGATVALTKTGYANIVATGVIVTSASQITCTLPITGAPAGQWNIVVTNQDTQTGTLNNGFIITALAPLTVTGITPSSAPITGPVTITNLAGTNFETGATVTLTQLGSAPISATGITVISPSQISCTIPITGAKGGLYDLTVQNPGGTFVTKPSAFTVITNQGVSIGATSPSGGTNSIDRLIIIKGTNFRTGATVILTNGITSYRLTNINLFCATSIMVVFPLKTSNIQPGIYSIIVVNSNGTFGTKGSCFTVTGLSTLTTGENQTPALEPVITQINPKNVMYQNIPVSIIITGANFSTDAFVSLDKGGIFYIGLTKTTSEQSIECSIYLNENSLGHYNLTVQNPDGSFATMLNALTISPAPNTPINRTPSGINRRGVQNLIKTSPDMREQKSSTMQPSVPNSMVDRTNLLTSIRR
ncbi:MAG TPA: IPT/TIG domain-containing protein, partial [Methanospirillum sp.]|nr:IPT/TIG domain-containing protein [Methanospirillum sp.]